MLTKVIGRPFKRLSRRVWLPIIELNLCPENAIVLAGSGRSGTTWLAQLINHDYSFRYYHEPFGPAVFPSLRPTLYLRKNNDETRYTNPIEQTLRGHRVWNWQRFNEYNRSVQPYKRVIFSKRLIKECRANLWLHWLQEKFPQTPLVFIMRHPCAVAYSMIHRRLPNIFQGYFQEKELIEDHLAPFFPYMQSAQEGSVWEQHVFNWCIQNYVPLRELNFNRTHLLFYENLILHPDREIELLFNFLGIRPGPRLARAFSKPSSTTRRASAVAVGGDLLGTWENVVTRNDRERALELVALFGLDKVYSAGAMPAADAAQTIVSRSRRSSRPGAPKAQRALD